MIGDNPIVLVFVVAAVAAIAGASLGLFKYGRALTVANARPERRE